MKLFLMRLSAILFGLLLALFLLELLLRLAYPLLPYTLQAPLREVHVTPFHEEKILPPQIVQPDRDYQLVSRANVDNQLQYPVPSVSMHVTTKNWLDPNSHVGFRVPSLDWEPRWPVDAVFIGDSFTFCFTEYKDCWVRQLETNYNLSVVNLGQGGTGSISHLNILQKFGLLHQPRFVVWQWYGNDFNEDYGMAIKYLGYPPVSDADIVSDSGTKAAWRSWLSGYSAVYALIDLALSSADERYQHTRFSDPYFLQEENLSLAYGREITIAGNDLSQKKNQIGRDLSQDAIRQAHQILTYEDIPLVLLLIPSKEEVYATWTEANLSSDTLATIAEGRQQMNQFCQIEGLLCLDMIDVLTVQANQGQQLYFVRDNHLNPQGNALLAETLWEFLQENELLPQT